MLEELASAGDSTGAGGALPPTHALSCSPTRRTAPNSEEGLRPTPKRGLRDAPGVHGGMRAQGDFSGLIPKIIYSDTAEFPPLESTHFAAS